MHFKIETISALPTDISYRKLRLCADRKSGAPVRQPPAHYATPFTGLSWHGSLTWLSPCCSISDSPNLPNKGTCSIWSREICQFCCCFGDPNAHCNSSTFCLSAGAAGEGSSGGPPPQGSGPAVSVERPLLSTTLQAEDGSQENQSGLADLPDKETVPVLSVGRHHSAERSSFFSFFPKELVFLQQLSFLFFFSRNTGLSPTDKNDPVKKSKCGFCFKMLHWFYFHGTVSLGSVMVSGIRL